ncbi:MAG TPA: M23 family metallopeptidase [Candidatus Polarisedimenticolia bacterium]|nr:M23 family metallopeptidase [Candidatus Polarisedimenticolia bacterium]
MSDRRYTIMIIPGTRAKLLRLKVRSSVLFALGSVAVLGLLSAALLPIVYATASHRSRVVASLQEENETLREASQEIATLREQVAFFESKASKFALMAGVENIPSAQGVGGLRQEQVQDTAIVSDEIDNLKERSGVLRQSFDLLEKVYRDQSLLLSSTPSIAPVKGMIAYGYAWRRDPFTGERAFHKGLDIVAPRGTRVKAPADAVVIKAGREAGYGNVIYLSHGNGLVTRYAHLDGFSVRPGQDVSRGEIIGYVGNTGRSLGAHLHYEVLVNNTKVDPSQYILDDVATF